MRYDAKVMVNPWRAALSLLVLTLPLTSCRAPTPASARSASAGPGVETETPTPAPRSSRDDAAPAGAFSSSRGESPTQVLVELFTSQGCNSCPPADAFIGELASLDWATNTVIPLTYHVTYWDDLGWRDPFAQQLFDQRQIGYAQQVPGRRDPNETTMRGPYTPQMVVGGEVHFSGTLRDVAREEILKRAQGPALVELSIERAAVERDHAIVELRSAARAGAELNTDKAKIGLFAALAHKQLATEVPRGENAGETLREFNVVRAFQGPKLFRSHRAENHTRFELAMPEGAAPDELRVVVFAQDLADLGVYAARVAPLVAS